MAAPFRSGPVRLPSSGEGQVLAMHCSDARFQPHFQQFLTGTFGAGRYATIAVPGGPQVLTLTEYLPKFSWAGWRWTKFMVDLARPERLVLIAHHDCRWYHDPRFAHPPDRIVAQQEADLRRARSALLERFPGTAIDLYFARLDGEHAVFEAVT